LAPGCILSQSDNVNIQVVSEIIRIHLLNSKYNGDNFFFHAELGMEPDHHYSVESQLGTQEKLNIIQAWKDLIDLKLSKMWTVQELQELPCFR
jgi:hypothetical protein